MTRFAWGCILLLVAYALLKAVTAGDAAPINTVWTFLSTIFLNLIDFVTTHLPSNI